MPAPLVIASLARIGAARVGGILLRAETGTYEGGGSFGRVMLGNNRILTSIRLSTRGGIEGRARYFGKSKSYAVQKRVLSGLYEAEDLAGNYLRIARMGNGKSANGGILGLGRGMASGVGASGASIKMDMSVDTSQFDAAMKEYVKFSKRDAKTIVNQKSFSIALGAYKYTYKVSKESLKQLLEAPANAGHGLRKADVYAITIARKKGKVIPKNIEVLGNKLIRFRASRVGSLPRTWLLAMNQLGAAIGKSARKGKAVGTGYGKPETTDTDLATAVLASITKYTDGKVDKYLNAGFQQAFNEEAASMRMYVQKKVDARNRQFST